MRALAVSLSCDNAVLHKMICRRAGNPLGRQGGPRSATGVWGGWGGGSPVHGRSHWSSVLLGAAVPPPPPPPSNSPSPAQRSTRAVPGSGAVSRPINTRRKGGGGEERGLLLELYPVCGLRSTDTRSLATGSAVPAPGPAPPRAGGVWAQWGSQKGVAQGGGGRKPGEGRGGGRAVGNAVVARTTAAHGGGLRGAG